MHACAGPGKDAGPASEAEEQVGQRGGGHVHAVPGRGCWGWGGGAQALLRVSDKEGTVVAPARLDWPATKTLFSFLSPSRPTTPCANTHSHPQDEALRGLPGLGRLLYGAASRLERGASTCLNCKGTGAVDCAECGASGLTGRASPLKGGGRRGLLRGFIKKLAGREDTAGGVASDATFMLSNRCRKCHGLGRVPCTACGGLGVRATVRRPGDLKQ